MKVNQLLIEKDQEQLITTGEQIGSTEDSLRNEESQSVEFGPTESSQQSTPYDAEQDWHERFGHYGR